MVIPLRNPLDHSVRLTVDLQTLPDVVVRFLSNQFLDLNIDLFRVKIPLKLKPMVKLAMNWYSNQRQLEIGLAGKRFNRLRNVKNIIFHLNKYYSLRE